jgi:AcrR family transcriptional regulator
MSVLENPILGPEDLAPAARIRNVALDLFARNGVKATSIRAVARAAGVSPGLVQHYYPSKAALREAVDRYVLEVAADAFADFPIGHTAGEVTEAIGKRITALFRDRHRGFRYVARGIVDGDERALKIFDYLVAIGDRLTEQGVATGQAHPDLDAKWASLNPLIYHFGVVLLEEAINRQLPQPLRTEEELERWRRASTDLFRRAIFRD